MKNKRIYLLLIGIVSSDVVIFAAPVARKGVGFHSQYNVVGNSQQETNQQQFFEPTNTTQQLQQQNQNLIQQYNNQQYNQQYNNDGRQQQQNIMQPPVMTTMLQQNPAPAPALASVPVQKQFNNNKSVSDEEFLETTMNRLLGEKKSVLKMKIEKYKKIILDNAKILKQEIKVLFA